VTEVSPDASTLKAWRHHLADEADAAFLYSALADVEPDAPKNEIYRRLAAVELRHVKLWCEVFEHHGLEVTAPQPSRRARLMVWLARRFGASLLTSVLLREEGQEVIGYLRLHRESADGTARETALQLAKESAEHARTLGALHGTSGEPWHLTESRGFLRAVVYGFNDGLTANFGLVAGVIGGDVAPNVVLISGCAGVAADALSMGASGYLAAKSERELYQHELEKERDEIELMPEVETEELALLYEAKGVDPERARQMAADVMRDPERALAEKAREELGIREEQTTPLWEGTITGTATAVGALIPVLPFLFLTGPWAIWTSFAISMLAHFAVGAMRTVFTGRGILRSGLDMFVVGIGVAGVGYLVGDLISRWLS